MELFLELALVLKIAQNYMECVLITPLTVARPDMLYIFHTVSQQLPTFDPGSPEDRGDVMWRKREGRG